jgi:hypothetical protein
MFVAGSGGGCLLPLKLTLSRTLVLIPVLPSARWGKPRSPALTLGPFLRFTGLPSRSALIAPPLRLAALWWRETPVALEWNRPPPGVSTACSVAVAHFSGRSFPGEPHTVLCPSKLERWRHNTVYGTPAVARFLAPPERPLDSCNGVH